jgi:hypothetical protein
MSWSTSAIGKPPAVMAKVAEEFSRHPCVEPEETVRQAAGALIAAALQAQDPNSVVIVSASGSQNQNYNSKAEKTTVNNTLNIRVEPVYGFVE